MNQQQVEQWIAQNGGSGRVQYQQSSREIDNPAADPITAKQAGVAFDPTAPAKLTIHEEKWVAVDDQGRPTGAELHVRRRPDGDFDVVNQSNANPAKPGNDPNSPASQQAAAQAQTAQQTAASAQELNNERSWNLANGGLYETHAERRERERKEAQENAPKTTSTQVTRNGQTYIVATTVDRNGNVTGTKTYDTSGKEVAGGLPAETPKDTPTVITRNGSTYIQHTTPGVNGKPGEIYYTDQQGNRVQLPNEPSKGTPAEPAGAPPASTDYGQISASLVRYRDFLNKQTQLFKDTGGREGLSPEDADKLMQARLTQAASAMAEQQGVVNTQTGIYGQQITEAQNERTDANNRRTQANSAYSTVMQSFVPLLKYMPEGGGQAFLDLLAHGMGAARQNAADWGGMKETPAPTLGPAAATANAAPMPGTQGTFLAGAIPPNAIGAGSIGAVPAPGAPIGQVAAGVTATNAAATNPTGANVQAATDATMQGSNAAFGALGVPAQQAPPPAVNPAAGEPGHNPNAPVGMLPGQGGMADRLLLPDDPNAPQPQISPEQVQALMSRTGMQGVRQGPDVYDGNSSGSFLAPYQGQQQQPSALDQLLSDPSIPNHIVARAYEQVYGVPLSSYGMS